MLDLAGILFSSLMILYIIVRAVRLDALTPWFETANAKMDSTRAGMKPGVVPWRERRQ